MAGHSDRSYATRQKIARSGTDVHGTCIATGHEAGCAFHGWDLSGWAIIQRHAGGNAIAGRRARQPRGQGRDETIQYPSIKPSPIKSLLCLSGCQVLATQGLFSLYLAEQDQHVPEGTSDKLTGQWHWYDHAQQLYNSNWQLETLQGALESTRTGAQDEGVMEVAEWAQHALDQLSFLTS